MENRWLFFNDLKDIKLKNNSGETAGGVEDVVLDLQTGRVVLYSLNRGGFLGAGSHSLALPPEGIAFIGEETRLLASEEVMEKAPGNGSDLPEHFDSSFIDRVYQHYGYKTIS